MKIKPEHFDAIKNAIEALVAKKGGDEWKKRIIESYKSDNLTSKRCRWDFFYASMPNTSRWVCDNLYPTGINDTHIDTALRKITGITY